MTLRYFKNHPPQKKKIQSNTYASWLIPQVQCTAWYGTDEPNLMANPFVAEAFSSWIRSVKSLVGSIWMHEIVSQGFYPVEPLFLFFEWGPTELQVPKSSAFSIIAELYSLFQPNLFPRNRRSALNSLKVSNLNN